MGQDIPDPPYPRHNARAALPVGTRRELENMSKEETHAKVRLFRMCVPGVRPSLFLLENWGVFDFGRGVRPRGGPRGVLGVKGVGSSQVTQNI